MNESKILNYVKNVRFIFKFVLYVNVVLAVECMIAVGGQCWFAASDAMRGALVQHFKRIGPTGACFQVPRLWEKFYENLAPQIGKATGIKKILIDWSMKQV